MAAHGFRSQDNMPGLPSPPNQILQGEGFYISYNDADVAIYGDSTTALVVGQMERFHILNGDHRAGYADLVPRGLEACLGYFLAHTVDHNHRSDRLENTNDTSGPAL